MWQMKNAFFKKVFVWDYITSLARAYGRWIGRMHIFFCDIFIIGQNLTILPVWL